MVTIVQLVVHIGRKEIVILETDQREIALIDRKIETVQVPSEIIIKRQTIDIVIRNGRTIEIVNKKVETETEMTDIDVIIIVTDTALGILQVTAGFWNVNGWSGNSLSNNHEFREFCMNRLNFDVLCIAETYLLHGQVLDLTNFSSFDRNTYLWHL